MGDNVSTFGGGGTSCDFCSIENAVRANLLAAIAVQDAEHEPCNVAVGDRTTLNGLCRELRAALAQNDKPYVKAAVYSQFLIGCPSFTS